MAGDLNLSNLKPAQARKDRKRVGRGMGSGKGRYSGRGIKGQKSRAGSHMMRAGFEGGQMPAYMRMGKQRGSTSKDAMPIGPFRTYVWNVNVRDLARFDAGTEITPELLKEAGLIRNIRRDVKVLGHGDLSAKLSVSAHSFSKSAVEKIEAAGGTVTWLKPPHQKKVRRHRKAAPGPAAEAAAGAAEVEEPAAEAAAEPAAEEPAEGE
jgi:large subunit ribosomal protein L15